MDNEIKNPLDEFKSNLDKLVDDLKRFQADKKLLEEIATRSKNSDLLDIEKNSASSQIEKMQSEVTKLSKLYEKMLGIEDE